MRRVVVTGLGVISPLGLSVTDTWQKIKLGMSGIEKISRFDASEFPSQIAGEVKNFDPSNYLELKEIKKTDRFIHFAIASATEAWRDSKLNDYEFKPNRAACIFGVGIGGLEMWERYHEILLKEGPRKISPFLIPGMIANLAPGQLAIKFGLKGPNFTTTSACASSAHSIGEGYRLIQSGLADIVVAGGSEAAVTPLGVGGFSALRALSTRNDEPQRASRPWDKGRDGFVISEGSATLILEELEHATKRGAKIYAEIIGYYANCDAYHITAPSEEGEGAIECMLGCLEHSKLEPHQVDYINAHGTSTPSGDLIELKAIKTVFKDSLDKICISSTKSMTGHLLGAAGALEAVFCIMAIVDNFIPPTINLEDPEPDCEGCDLVPLKGKERKIDVALSNSFGFGGTNACLLFKRLT